MRNNLIRVAQLVFALIVFTLHSGRFTSVRKSVESLIEKYFIVALPSFEQNEFLVNRADRRINQHRY